MAAVGYCGEWFVFFGGTKLVAVHSKHDRSGESHRVQTAGAEKALLAALASGNTLLLRQALGRDDSVLVIPYKYGFKCAADY